MYTGWFLATIMLSFPYETPAIPDFPFTPTPTLTYTPAPVPTTTITSTFTPTASSSPTPTPSSTRSKGPKTRTSSSTQTTTSTAIPTETPLFSRTYRTKTMTKTRTLTQTRSATLTAKAPPNLDWNLTSPINFAVPMGQEAFAKLPDPIMWDEDDSLVFSFTFGKYKVSLPEEYSGILSLMWASIPSIALPGDQPDIKALDIVIPVALLSQSNYTFRFELYFFDKLWRTLNVNVVVELPPRPKANVRSILTVSRENGHTIEGVSVLFLETLTNLWTMRNLEFRFLFRYRSESNDTGPWVAIGERPEFNVASTLRCLVPCAPSDSAILQFGVQARNELRVKSVVVYQDMELDVYVGEPEYTNQILQYLRPVFDNTAPPTGYWLTTYLAEGPITNRYASIVCLIRTAYFANRTTLYTGQILKLVDNILGQPLTEGSLGLFLYTNYFWGDVLELISPDERKIILWRMAQFLQIALEDKIKVSNDLGGFVMMTVHRFWNFRDPLGHLSWTSTASPTRTATPTPTQTLSLTATMSVTVSLTKRMGERSHSPTPTVTPTSTATTTASPTGTRRAREIPPASPSVRPSRPSVVTQAIRDELERSRPRPLPPPPNIIPKPPMPPPPPSQVRAERRIEFGAPPTRRVAGRRLLQATRPRFPANRKWWNTTTTTPAVLNLRQRAANASEVDGSSLINRILLAVCASLGGNLDIHTGIQLRSMNEHKGFGEQKGPHGIVLQVIYGYVGRIGFVNLDNHQVTFDTSSAPIEQGTDPYVFFLVSYPDNPYSSIMWPGGLLDVVVMSTQGRVASPKDVGHYTVLFTPYIMKPRLEGDLSDYDFVCMERAPNNDYDTLGILTKSQKFQDFISPENIECEVSLVGRDCLTSVSANSSAYENFTANLRAYVTQQCTITSTYVTLQSRATYSPTPTVTMVLIDRIKTPVWLILIIVVGAAIPLVAFFKLLIMWKVRRDYKVLEKSLETKMGLDKQGEVSLEE